MPETKVPQTLLNLYDELHKQIAQTRGIVATLSCEGILADLPEERVAEVLWLVTDRLADIDNSAVACLDATRANA